jgi:hypothetical protein
VSPYQANKIIKAAREQEKGWLHLVRPRQSHFEWAGDNGCPAAIRSPEMPSMVIVFRMRPRVMVVGTKADKRAAWGPQPEMHGPLLIAAIAARYRNGSEQVRECVASCGDVFSAEIEAAAVGVNPDLDFFTVTRSR